MLAENVNLFLSLFRNFHVTQFTFLYRVTLIGNWGFPREIVTLKPFQQRGDWELRLAFYVWTEASNLVTCIDYFNKNVA